MVKKTNVKLVFDLDGTIAPYKKPVPKKIADYLNTLGHIYVITGGSTAYAKIACKQLKNATVIGMADEHTSIDLAKALITSKSKFFRTQKLQKIRLLIVKQLNSSLKKSGLKAYCGGRSTIDIMKKNKADMVDGHIIYFYDCLWGFNLKYSNDWPIICKAKKAIRTDWTKVIADVSECLEKLK